MPRVSIIVPVYRAEQFLERCIKSIQNQTIEDWELILIDDSSPDNSFSIISEYAKIDNRIVVRRQEDNHGPMVARRVGDELSTGDYITYCDADDILPNNALELLYDAAINTKADIVSGNYTYVKCDGSQVNIISSLDEVCGPENLLRALLNNRIPQGLWGKLFKSELIKGHNYKVIDHMTNAEDGYMLYQMSPNVSLFKQISDVVYLYMQSPDSSSQRRYSDNALENIVLMNALRVSFINRYPNLKKDIVYHVSDILNGLIINGYDKEGFLSELMNKYHLKYYGSDRALLTTHSFLDSLKILTRKHFSFLFNR